MSAQAPVEALGPGLGAVDSTDSVELRQLLQFLVGTIDAGLFPYSGQGAGLG